MIGEVSIGGVYVPLLLLMAGVALIGTIALSRLLAALSAYRLVAYRPLIDVALFVILLGLIDRLVLPLEIAG